MKNAVRGIVALAGLAVFGVAQASNWIVIRETSNPQLSIDAQSIRKLADGSVTVWVQQRYPAPKTLANGAAYTYFMAHNRFFCQNRQLSMGEIHWYAANGASVKTDLDDGTVRDVAPDSTAEFLLDLACGAAAKLSSN